jgi:hypothetical protein
MGNNTSNQMGVAILTWSEVHEQHVNNHSKWRMKGLLCGKLGCD